LIRVDRELWDGHKLHSCDTRYFISSLDPSFVTPEDLQRSIRGHWQVETSLHLLKDRWWEEDKHHLRRSGLGDVWISLTNMSLSLLRYLKSPNEPMTAGAENVSHRPKEYLKKISFK
jgi:predicted transposase YbfD/YdcC